MEINFTSTNLWSPAARDCRRPCQAQPSPADLGPAEKNIFSFTHIFYGFSPAGYIRQNRKRGRVSGTYFTDLKTLFSIRSNNLKIFMESVNAQCAKLVVATCHAVDSKCFDVIYVSSVAVRSKKTWRHTFPENRPLKNQAKPIIWMSRWKQVKPHSWEVLWNCNKISY